MLRGAPLRYRPFSGFSQANAPAASMPVITAVNKIVDRYRFVNCSCCIKPPGRSPEDFLPVTNVGVTRRPLVSGRRFPEGFPSSLGLPKEQFIVTSNE